MEYISPPTSPSPMEEDVYDYDHTDNHDTNTDSNCSYPEALQTINATELDLLLPNFEKPTPPAPTMLVPKLDQMEYVSLNTPYPSSSTIEYPELPDLGDLILDNITTEWEPDSVLNTLPITDDVIPESEINNIVSMLAALNADTAPSTSGAIPDPTPVCMNNPQDTPVNAEPQCSTSTESGAHSIMNQIHNQQLCIDQATQTNRLDLVRDICIVKSLPQSRPRDSTPTRDERHLEDLELLMLDSDEDY